MNSPAPIRPFLARRSFRRGLSLMELLIATTISILVMGAAVTLFGVVGERINAGRAMIETSDKMRAVQNLLRRDLRGVTVSFLPWEQPSAGSGYFELLKGPAATNRDSQPDPTNTKNVLLGYTQDVLMFTTRSPDQPFTGRYVAPNGTPSTFESPLAEVVWYMQPSFNAVGQRAMTYTLYRRQFPIVAPGSSLKFNPRDFFENYDVSAHPDGQGNMVANSLADLTYRENRFAHNNVRFNAQAPYYVNATTLTAPPATSDGYSLTPFPLDSQRYGEDVMLTNVLSFDVKVWDPGAQVLQDPSSPSIPPLVPSDPGYKNGQALNPPQYGAYVDLNYKNTAPLPWSSTTPPDYFAGPYYGLGLQKSGLAANNNNGIATYDSWCGGYEYYSEKMAATAYNLGGNGFDDDSQNGVDDPSERFSSPPYPVPLRGVQIKIRVYEPSTRQVREITIDETFLQD